MVSEVIQQYQGLLLVVTSGTRKPRHAFFKTNSGGSTWQKKSRSAVPAKPCKLMFDWIGPYCITKIKSKSTMDIQDKYSKKIFYNVHISKIKPLKYLVFKYTYSAQRRSIIYASLSSREFNILKDF
ncbi:hypothetical protein K501DRAFT_277809 [Backusella circina FSU 941]|nr:hypothetical protein K501DRAFT_277809 [Backusella circina FSU 941]